MATPALLLSVVAYSRGEIRLAGDLMAASLGLAALLRLVLPEGRSGGLAVRSRLVDVATMATLGVALAVVTTVLDLTPRG